MPLLHVMKVVQPKSAPLFFFQNILFMKLLRKTFRILISTPTFTLLKFGPMMFFISKPNGKSLIYTYKLPSTVTLEISQLPLSILLIPYIVPVFELQTASKNKSFLRLRPTFTTFCQHAFISFITLMF